MGADSSAAVSTASSTSTASEAATTASSSSSNSSITNETYEISSLTTAQQHPSENDSNEQQQEISPTFEQLLSLDRQKHDPPSYYQELSLNKGPVDKVARLCNVSSQYAIDDLQIFSAMDSPEQQYKLKSLAQHEFDRYNSLPAETAHGIDQSQICYEDGEVYFRDY